MGAAITDFRKAVKARVTAEFVAEGFTVYDDKLHESIGADGAIAAVYPEREEPKTGAGDIVQVMLVTVQVFNGFDAQIDPTLTVDPAVIEGWAWRLQRRFFQTADPNTTKMWYFNVAQVIYPDDPTGNKTRFIMSIEGYGPNPAIVETVP